MRKLYLFNMITLDGYFEGPERDISWHTVDKDFNEFAVEQLKATDLIIFGRITYRMMAAFWPTEQARMTDPVVAGFMNETSKIVVSSTMDRAEWQNTRLITTNVQDEILKVKHQPGNDIAIFGSSILASSVLDLIDEYRIMVSPLFLGAGRPLFLHDNRTTALKLIASRSFSNGNVLLTYCK